MELDNKQLKNNANGMKSSTKVSNDDDQKQIAERSIQCIYEQIAWANYRFGTVDAGVGERNQLVSFLKNCYETIDLLNTHR